MRLLIVFLIGVFVLNLNGGLVGQQEQITLEGIWNQRKFNPKRVPGFRFMNDGVHYTRKIGSDILRYSIVSGEVVDTVFSSSEVSSDDFSGSFNSYEFSADEGLLLIKAESEAIYRRSTKAFFYVYDRDSEEMSAIFREGKIMHCTLSPDGSRVAFVFENDLYWKNFRDGIVSRITTDGKYNHVINGSADWVYEEEFGFTKAFQWSPDSRKVGFYRFDESGVKEFSMEYYTGGMYPNIATFKYPKVDEDNALVTIHIFDIDSGKTVTVDKGSEPDGYIPRIKWTSDPSVLCVFRMNRHQNHLELLLANAESGKSKVLLEEENKYYVDINDDLTFLSDGQGFVWSSEKDGWNQLYVYDMDGQEKVKLTDGDYDITSLYGVDEENGRVYFQAAKDSPLSRQIFRVNLNGKGMDELAGGEGTHSAQFSSTFDYYVRTSSSVNSAPVYSVYRTKGNKEQRVIEENAGIADLQESHNTSELEFFTFDNRDGTPLNGWMIKPADFDSNKTYPVFMYLYGGPGSQQVLDSWRGTNYWWFQMLAQKGFIVACVDNRGTGARGEEFRKMTYQKLGHYETLDQIDAARYLGGLDYTDASRIGIFGWSYGGYMSSLCLLKGNDVFKSAIAVAPVTNWKWYDTIYTERYMRGYSENTDGYDQNSPINFVDRLKGDYLLVHGITDDNVHWQHTVEMANALISANKQFDTYFYPKSGITVFDGNNASAFILYTKMTELYFDRTLGR